MAVRENVGLSKAIADEMLASGLEEIPKRFPKGFWDGVYERLPEELRTKWNLNSMAGIWKQRKLKMVASVARRLKAAETDDSSQAIAGIFQQMIGGASAKAKERQDKGKKLLALIDRRIEKKLGYPMVDIRPLGLPHDEPPMPPKEGKKELGSKRHISARADSNLVDLFERDARNRFHGNASRTLDWVLWNFYGKPQLSFELEGQAQGYFTQEEEPETVGEQ